ncbi:hypothetical protein E2C01_038672 [Portunus trituberculatus]|uniref:Uncharacterized protein n=1 Tax=Portunus trituberculatus TaxID=210409 RepID=A0A5B7FJ54_PORTR|nr:hypothetical protein [Portunus trituberculatus]
MDGHGQAEKEASEVLRSFNILGAPRSTPNEPQNLSTSTSQPMVMVPPHPPPQWHIHPQPVHIMTYQVSVAPSLTPPIITILTFFFTYLFIYLFILFFLFASLTILSVLHSHHHTSPSLPFFFFI